MISFRVRPSVSGFSIVALIIISCGPVEIDRIDCCVHENLTGMNYNSILLIQESGHLMPLEDSLRLSQVLFPWELQTAFDTIENVDPSTSVQGIWRRKIVYKRLRVLFDTLGFTAETIILDSLGCKGRDYRVQVRTYARDRHIIDTLTYALWSKCLNKWCSGVVYDDMTIDRIWKDPKRKERFSITAEGRFRRLDQ